MNIQEISLPDTWNLESIKDIYQFTKKPRGLQVKEFETIPFIPMDLVPLDNIYINEWVEKPTAKLGSGTYFENGDLLVAKITPSFENGKQGITKIDMPFGYATTEVIPIKAIEGVSDKLYLHFVLLHPGIRSQLAGKMEGSTGRQRLSKTILGDSKIPLPPLSEQRQIVHIFSVVQQAIEHQAQLIALTKELKSALMNKLFTEGLRGEARKETEIASVPGSWDVVRLDEHAIVKGGKRLPKGEKLIDKITSFPYIRVTDFSDFSINKLSLKYLRPDTQKKIANYRISDKDIYISIAGSIGITGMVPSELDGANLTENAAKIVIQDEKIEARFLMYFLASEAAQREIKSQTVKNAQPKLALARIKSLYIPVPQKDEQTKIVYALETLRNKILHANEKKYLLEELLKTFLDELITGKIRVDGLEEIS